jgi:hypothetical protein
VLRRRALILRELVTRNGVEGWRALPTQDEDRSVAIGVDWEGDDVTVHVTSIDGAELLPADVSEVVLAGRTAIGDGTLAFDCGADRFVIETAERRRLLEVGSILLDGLVCEATPPA